MATIEICDFLDVFKKANHSATSFRYIDGDTGQVLDQSLENKDNLFKWTSQLSDGKGGHYRKVKNLIAQAKFHYGKDSSDWVVVGDPYDQTAYPQLIHQCKIKE